MNKTTFIVLLVLVSATVTFINSCGRKGPEAPPDILPPTIIATSPYYDETNVPLNAVILVTFNEAMQGGSISAQTVSLLLGAGPVNGTASASGAKAIFKPEADLLPNSTYRVSITTGVKDLSGNSMTAPFVYSFVTGTTTAAGTFTVTPSAGAHGSISPATAQSVVSQATASFTVTADAGYHAVTPVGGTCGGSMSGGIFTTDPVTADCSVAVAFAADGTVSHTVTASAGPNGSISPSGAVTVSHGATRSFTITANANYHVVTPVGGTCGGTLAAGTYTTSAVNSDCTVIANFAMNVPSTHTVTASAGANGSISPSGAVTVSHGASREFTLLPASGYRISSVGGTCGGSLSGSTYTTNAVNADCTVSASFAVVAPETHTITAAAGDHGSISPSGKVTVNDGSRRTFTITPSKGYRTVTPVGGTCGGSLSGSTYTTEPVNADCTVSPSFARVQSTVTPSAGPNGTILPATPQLVYYEETTSFTVTPNNAYRIAAVSGCGGSLAGNLYTTGLVTADCTVAASFAAALFTVTPSAGLHGTIIPGTPQQAAYNTSLVFTVTPDPSYRIASVSGCGGSLAGSSYTTGRIGADCTVAASFADALFTVTPSAGLHGTIVPGTPQQAAYNTPLVFTVTPDPSYRIASVSGCGGSLTGSTYTTGPISGDCVVAAAFEESTVIVTPAAGDNGQLTPAEAQQVGYNGVVSFTITPAPGYVIGSVSGCGGTLQGSVYTTAPVTADCTVAATFVQSIAI
jgi:hypothetical protein